MSGGERESPRKFRIREVGESGDSRFIRRVLFAVKHVIFLTFAALEQPAGRISKKGEHSFFKNTIRTGSIDRKYRRV